jgi:hypothetical protein
MSRASADAGACRDGRCVLARLEGGQIVFSARIATGHSQ